MIVPQTAETPTKSDFPRARSFSVFQQEEPGLGQATKKRDLKYQDYYDYISGPPPPQYQPFSERAQEKEEFAEPPSRAKEKHFSGFENDSLLSQVGKSVNLRVSKSIRPGANYGPKPGSKPGSGIPNINEPLFYPEKPLSAPLKAKAHERERDFLMNQGMADIQLTPGGPGRLPRLTPGPGGVPRVTPTPHHSYQVTQPYQPSPLPHPSSGPQYPARPTPDPYLARPLAFSSPDHPSLHSPSPSPGFSYSPPPYLGRGQNHERQYVPPTTTLSPYHARQPGYHPVNNFLSGRTLKLSISHRTRSTCFN